MPDYEIADFLLFSPEVYWRLFALENEALFPWTLVAPAVGVVAVLSLRGRPRLAFLALCVLLAASWTIAGASFLWSRYGAVNWAAPYAAPLFVAAAATLALCAVRAPSRIAADSGGRALMLFAFVLYPLAAPLFGRDIASAEIACVAPDPTAAASLGLSLLLREGAARAVLRAAALGWLCLSAFTLWALGGAEWTLPILSTALFGAAVLLRSKEA